jgi:hypothetical protein
MRANRWLTVVGGLVLSVGLALASGVSLSASHSWGPYHWARTTASFDLALIDSTTSDWQTFVAVAAVDWSTSNVLNLVVELDASADAKVRRQCRAPSGAVRVCNLAYGYNGWLGVAGISIDAAGHIVSGYTKLNDSYFSLASYNTPDWKQSVTCQELGHNLGLDHQDEDFNNTSLSSCMDYQTPPYPSANGHDFEQLAKIYGHLDSYDSYAGGGGEDTGGGDDGSGCKAPQGVGCNRAGGERNEPDAGWGLSLGRRGARETFIRIDPDGTRHLTFVTWATRR